MLPTGYKWMETPRTWGLWVPPGGIPIYIRKSDASILIRWGGVEIRAKAASVAQAKRHLARWVSARTDKPWGRGKKGGFERRTAMPAEFRDSMADYAAENPDDIREFKPGELNALLERDREARRRR